MTVFPRRARSLRSTTVFARHWQRWLGLCGAVLLLLGVSSPVAQAEADDEAPATRRIELADGFDFPVGTPVGTAENYYVFRGWTPGHPGEDWNGNGMGNSDLGDPITSIAKGVVILARQVGGGWGNTAIIRHVYRNPRTGMIEVVDSFYTHMQRLDARYGQLIEKGAPVGTIGTNNGMYAAHLHFEMRHGPGLNIGTHRGQFPRDMAHYYRPRDFINDHRQLRPERRTRATVRIDQFQGN